MILNFEVKKEFEYIPKQTLRVMQQTVLSKLVIFTSHENDA